MDPNGNIYHSVNPPAEDVARLDGYVRGLGAHDDTTAEQMEAMSRDLHVAQEDAHAAEVRADLNEMLRREAQQKLDRLEKSA